MDFAIPDLILFIVGTFAASLVAGLAGFAFGIVAAGVWLHILTAAQTTALIVGFGLIVQGVAVWKLRRALKLARLAPFLIGGAIGVPLGVDLLHAVPPVGLRAGIGVLLILFSLYSLIRPALSPVTTAGNATDGAVGVLNGMIGGATGLAGIVTTIWCGLRGWPKDEQRAVFQPVGVAVFAMTALWLGRTGLIDGATLQLFALGLPAVFAGTWVGLRLYGRLDESGFRRLVLILLLISGVVLVFSVRG